ncbi:MAG: cysteine desulfurase [Eubacteriales bacterium]|nr:cysteine desulfurase [Eubacteriales bacterium]
MICYFDNAASTKPYDEAVELYAKLLTTEYANPSALHSFGYEAMKLVEAAKKEVTSIHDLKDFEPIFTSGATESVNLAIKGTIDKFADIRRTHIITTGIEHACVTNTCLYLEEKGASVTYLPTDSLGKIDTALLTDAINEHTKIVSVIWVNNETGIVQDIEAICRAVKAKDPGILVHLDATQGFGKIPQDLSCADLISVSAHKFHGMKGIGILYIRKGVHINGIMKGGGQQDDLRSGTINAPMIAALGKTVSMTDPVRISAAMLPVRDRLYDSLTEAFGEDAVNSKIRQADYAPHILNVSFPGLKGEVILHMLEQKGIYISTSSACSSRKKKKSVLEHMGFSQERINGTIRISISEFTTLEEADCLIAELKSAVELLKGLRG